MNHRTVYWEDQDQKIHFNEKGEPSALCGYKPPIGVQRMLICEGFAIEDVECVECCEKAFDTLIDQLAELMKRRNRLASDVKS